MIEPKVFFRILVFAFLMCILTLTIDFLVFDSAYIREIAYGFISSLLLFSFSFFSIRWGSRQRVQILLAIIMGGMFLRFLVIGVFFYLLHLFTSLNIKLFVAIFVLFFLLSHIFELYYAISTISSKRKRSLKKV